MNTHIHTVCIWQCKHFSLVTQAKYFVEIAHIHFQEYLKKEDYTFHDNLTFTVLNKEKETSRAGHAVQW